MKLGHYKFPPYRNLRLQKGVTSPRSGSRRHLFALCETSGEEEWKSATCVQIQLWRKKSGS
jgi:hypothetical protein